MHRIQHTQGQGTWVSRQYYTPSPSTQLNTKPVWELAIFIIENLYCLQQVHPRNGWHLGSWIDWKWYVSFSTQVLTKNMQRATHRQIIDSGCGISPATYKPLPHKKELKEILQPSTSKSFLETSRLDSTNRLKQLFGITLKWKLRLELWPKEDIVTCACGQHMYRFRDHTFCCNRISKTTMSKEIRDVIIRLLKILLPTARMFST